MKVLILCMVLLTAVPALSRSETMDTNKNVPVVFVTYAGNNIQLQRATGLARSIRAFAGQHKEAPIWVYCTKELIDHQKDIIQEFAKLNVDVRIVEIPEEVAWYYLSGMVYSAASAEDLADSKVSILVFMGSDTVVLQEPHEFELLDSISLGYRPVFHRNINPLFSEELDAYLSRAYEIMSIDESDLFPMVTPADSDTIRPYINAGCLVVRPERGLLRQWPTVYEQLCSDSLIRRECETETLKRVFTFQVALTGTILKHLRRDEMIALSDRYNYPIFFREMYGAKRDFHDITDITTIRYESFFGDPIEGWDKILKGPSDRIEWMRENLIQDDD